MPTAMLLALLALPMQAPEPVLPRQPATVSLRVPMLVFSSAAAADWITTYRNLQHPGEGRTGLEQNPLLHWTRNRPWPTVIAGASMDVAGVWAWNHYVGKRHPKAAKAGLYAMTGVRLWLTARNLRNHRH